MNIPASAIRPFEPHGIPAIGLSDASINTTLNAFFDVVVRTASIADANIEANANIFRSVSENLVYKMGATSGEASFLRERRDPKGKLLAVSICVQYIMPDGTRHTNYYRLE